MTEPFSIPDYRDLRDGNRTFESLAATFQWSANLTGGEAERVQGMRASSAFFSMLGIRADLGRTLTAADEQGSGGCVFHGPTLPVAGGAVLPRLAFKLTAGAWPTAGFDLSSMGT